MCRKPTVISQPTAHTPHQLDAPGCLASGSWPFSAAQEPRIWTQHGCSLRLSALSSCAGMGDFAVLGWVKRALKNHSHLFCSIFLPSLHPLLLWYLVLCI